MTDAHCHVTCGVVGIRELLIGRDFLGVHPWESPADLAAVMADLRVRLAADRRLGVGEIGLDRLRVRTVPPAMRELFEAQLDLALEFDRPVVLHGAKCWGDVVDTVRRALDAHPVSRPRLLFHGFSRSDGLIPDLVALGGYVSVGPTVLNDHAVNYRELVRKLPLERLLVETDRTEGNARDCPGIREVLAKTAELRGMAFEALEAITDRNGCDFLK